MERNLSLSRVPGGLPYCVRAKIKCLLLYGYFSDFWAPYVTANGHIIRGDNFRRKHLANTKEEKNLLGLLTRSTRSSRRFLLS